MTSEHQQGISEAELLHVWLSSRDVPCPICGYSLRSIESATCPECGARLDVRVGSTDLRIGLWLVGVIALTLAFGFVGFFTIFIMVPAMMTGFAMDHLVFVAITTGMMVGYMLLLRRLIRRRQKFWSKPRTGQKLDVALYLLAASAPVTIPVVIWLFF